MVLVAKDAQFSWWQWLKVQHGFRDEQLRPYNFNLGPFLADKKSVQQGYSIAEPFSVKKQAGFDPVYGARPLKRAIQQQIENPLAERILQGQFAAGDRILVAEEDGALKFEKRAN